MALNAVVVVVTAMVLELRRNAFGFYEDEGINLLKAFMVASGHPLYREVYSDQAPLFTLVLVAAGRLLHWQYEPLRHVAVLFGVTTLTAAYALARHMGGRMAGLVSLALLLVMAPVQKFSTTLVIATPALAFAGWSLFIAMIAVSPSLAGLSGVLWGLACCTKASFIYFAPLVLMAILLRSPDVGLTRRRLLALAAGGCAPVAVFLAAYPASQMLTQMTAPHVAALALFADQAAGARRFMLLSPGFPALYLSAAIGAVVLWRGGRRRFAGLMATWCMSVLTWLLTLRPIWSHHVPELLVPLAILIGMGVGAGARGARRRCGNERWAPSAMLRSASILALGVGTVLHLRSYDEWRAWYDNTAVESLRSLARIIERATTAEQWIVVDRPMLAFLAHRKVPPSLAMVSRKRIAVGGLTDSDVMGVLARYQPATVTLCSGQFTRGKFPRFLEALTTQFREVSVEPLSFEFAGLTRSCALFLRP